MTRTGICGHPLSRYNAGPLCFACDRAHAGRRFTPKERRAAILIRLETEAVSNAMVREQFGVSDRVARQDMRQLVNAGLVEAYGPRRFGRYRLRKDAAA